MFEQLVCLVFGAGIATSFFKKDEIKAAIVKRMNNSTDSESPKTPSITELKGGAYKPSMTGGGLGYVI